MQIFNTTTNNFETIAIIVNGVDAFADLSQISTNNDFTRDDDGEYQASDETINWWKLKADEYQKMYDLIAELKPDHADELQSILDDAQGCEFNDYPSYVIAELKEITK